MFHAPEANGLESQAAALECALSDHDHHTNSNLHETASPPTSPEKEKIVVGWDENDPENPKCWSTGYKSWLTFQLGMLALAASLGSSIISPAEDAISSAFGVSHEVTVLCISFYIIGFAFGPLLWAPISEVRI